MKRSLKLLGLTFAIACVFSAYAAASSFASEFYFHDTGETITGTKTVSGSLSGSATLSATVSGISTTITCTSATTTGHLTNASGSGKASSVALSFSGCAVTPAALKCTISSQGAAEGSINVSNLAGETSGTNVKFTPESGTTFVTLETHGASCKLGNGTLLNVTGSSTGAAGVGTLTFTGKNGLSFGGAEATFAAVFSQTVEGRTIEVK